MQKKVIRFILVSVLFICFMIDSFPALAGSEEQLKKRLKGTIVLYTGSSKAFVSNRETKIDENNPLVKPLVKNNRTLLPVRFVSENMGAEVKWDSNTSAATVILADRTVKLKLNSREMIVDGTVKALDVAAMSINGRIYIPLRALAEALGKHVFYDRGLIVISDQKEIFRESEKQLVDALLSRYTEASTAGSSVGETTESLVLEKYDGGFFTVEKPRGWKIYTAGEGSTLAFLMCDPEQPLRKVFYFTSIGPFYMSVEQKMLDYQYMQMGGYPILWYEMPVIDPLTPENFFKNFSAIAETQIAENFMPQCPHLDNFQVISKTTAEARVPGGNTGIVRGVFIEAGKAGEGLFAATAAPFMPYTGGPGAGNAYAFLVTGITAPRGEFRALVDDLDRCLKSFTVSEEYVHRYMQQSQAAFEGILKAGRTLSETSDIIMESWQKRSRVHDVLAEKRSDAILGKERLYDPETGEVYEFENGFYDYYSNNRENYRMNSLRPLEDDEYNLWLKPPLDGPKHLE